MGKKTGFRSSLPFGRLDSVNLRGAVEALGETVCGGIGAWGEFVTVRHAAPLLNLDINELERPLFLVTSTADDLEHKFQSGDNF
jgi:hypothetical protein